MNVSTRSTPRPALFTTFSAAALGACLLFTGCGGGGTEDGEVTLRALAVPQEAKPASVQLEGCVVDAQWMGAAGTAVHVRTAQGQAVGTAFSNARGVFALQVPARAALVVDTSLAGTGGLTLNTGSSALSVAACLQADS
jgi:hypothetical protein